MRKVLVIAPHPDDETLGCGGTLLKHKNENDELFWLIVTGMNGNDLYTPNQIEIRENEINKVGQLYGFSEVFQLNLPTATLDTIPMSEMVNAIGKIVKTVNPDIMYIPYRGDVHTDHAVVFDASIACTKWFRYPSIKRILAYETLSETDFGLNPDNNGFRPNVFQNIEEYLNKKVDIMGVYASEIGQFPFPRSEESIKALASIRGTAAGYKSAEAFMLLKEVL